MRYMHVYVTAVLPIIPVFFTESKLLLCAHAQCLLFLGHATRVWRRYEIVVYSF